MRRKRTEAVAGVAFDALRLARDGERLDPALRAALDKRAAKDATTVSDVIRKALRRYVDAV